MDLVGTRIEWRGAFTNEEVNELHAEAFETRVFDESECNWQELTGDNSLGWVVARQGETLVGFVNVVWDGMTHAWIQDVMVALSSRHQGTGVRLIETARDAAKEAKCEWLHVDFDENLSAFYFDACGFEPTTAGLMNLS